MLAEADGEPVGHGAVVVRVLAAGGRTLRTGYVEAVATAAPRRRRGIGSAVMAEVERLVAGGFELGALSSSRQAVGLYAARGWERWSGAVAALTPDGVVESPGEAVFVLPTPQTPAGLDTSGRLVCDWRPGDLLVRPARGRGARAGRRAVCRRPPTIPCGSRTYFFAAPGVEVRVALRGVLQRDRRGVDRSSRCAPCRAGSPSSGRGCTSSPGTGRW